jgi:precorrin-3B C17-methyltransferase
LSIRAAKILKTVDIVVGYTVYIELVEHLIKGKKIFSTGMKKEVDRVQTAIEMAMSSDNLNGCAVVSSGDSGIYAMAGLVFEVCKKKGLPIKRPGSEQAQGENSLVIEVVPGIPALASGASLLGAPLMHDFAVISLSDLLTPWEVIEKRIEAAAMADFSIVLFNPKSKKRNWQLEKACDIILKFRKPETPAGIVKNAMRDGEKVEIMALKDLAASDADMLTTVFIGNSSSERYLDYIITPRGYSGKYAF